MLGTKPTSNIISSNTLYSVRSSIGFGAKWLGLSTFIFYSMVVMLKCINLILLSSAEVCQPCITNKSHKTGSNNAEA